MTSAWKDDFYKGFFLPPSGPARILGVALNIKDPETDRLVRELAELTGESITTATRRAVEQRLEVLRLRNRPKRDLRGIIERGRARTVHDTRTPDEIIGYDADGIPS